MNQIANFIRRHKGCSTTASALTACATVAASTYSSSLPIGIPRAQAGHLDALAFEQFGDDVRGDFAFPIGEVGGEDDFL